LKLSFVQIDRSELSEVLKMFKLAAQQIQKKNLTQWSQWINPQKSDLDWLEDGFAKNEFYFVYLNGEHAGMFRYLKKDEVYWENQNEKARYVHSLVVKKEYAGLNLGKQILSKIEEKIIKEDCYFFRLDCNSANPWLCNFYESLGFKQKGIFQKNEDSSFNLYEKDLRI